MALPPTIPTSFVPKQPVATQARQKRSGTNLFMLIAAVVVGLAALAAASAFAYELFLTNTRDAKTEELVRAQQAVDIDTVEGFIRLKNRLASVETLLDQHVELSEFFTTLEARTLQAVRFSTLSVTVEEDRSAEIIMDGVATSFNALAAQSSAVASERLIRRAIFSDIAVNANGTVAFSLTATLDPRLITSGEVLPGVADQATLPTAPSDPVLPEPDLPAEPAAEDPLPEPSVAEPEL